jgi:hypothetical protein
MGDAGIGESCVFAGIEVGTDTCDGEGWCFQTQEIEGELVGECFAFCDGTPNAPECPDGSSCSISGDGTVTICLPNCDPLVQDCNDGQGCYWTNADFQCVFATSDYPEGEPCGYINDCAPGNACVVAETLPACDGASCCAAWCNLDAPDCSIPGTSCTPWFEQGEAPAGLDHIGICVSP